VIEYATDCEARIARKEVRNWWFN